MAPWKQGAFFIWALGSRQNRIFLFDGIKHDPMETALFRPTLLLACLFLSGLASANPHSLVESLANRPIGLVQDGVCHVRGAVWANGPRGNVPIALIDVVSGEVFDAVTDARGVYALSIPYSVPAVLQERIAAPIGVPERFRADVQIHEGGVVCDHRLTHFPASESAP